MPPETQLETTTIGSFPKPGYVTIRDLVHPGSGYRPTFDSHEAEEDFFKRRATETNLTLATYDVVRAQVDVGIKVPTDGEQRREHYIYYHQRHLNNIDFNRMQPKVIRGVEEWGEEMVPTIVGAATPKGHFLRYDWKVAQKYAGKENPVKITMPGPMTMTDQVVDEHYGGDSKKLGIDLANALNVEILDLVDAGCEWIQVDEPLFARFPKDALAYGIENLEKCFYDVPKHVKRVVHLCCGYPQYVDQPEEDIIKADPESYLILASALNEANIGAVSIEDAYRHVDLELLEYFTGETSVIFGSVDIANSIVEPMEEIRDRLNEALQHIDPHRLIVGPDCGLGMLPERIALEKLENLVSAAHSI